MKTSILISLLVIACLIDTAYPSFDLSLFGCIDIPSGAFAQKQDIVETSIPGWSYTAKGGGAEGGIGWDFDFGIRVHKRVRVGGSLGYSELDADATDVCEKVVKPVVPYVEDIQSQWVMRYVGVLMRIDALKIGDLDFYARLGAGVVRVRNEIDVQTVRGNLPMEFDFRNQFYFCLGCGFESLLAPNMGFVCEVIFNQILSDGAEASGSPRAFGSTYNLHGVQRFDMQVIRIKFGVRMNLGR